MPDEAPYRNFNFRVEIDGLPETTFREVVIPGTRIEVVEYRVGADKVSGTRSSRSRSDGERRAQAGSRSGPLALELVQGRA